MDLKFENIFRSSKFRIFRRRCCGSELFWFKIFTPQSHSHLNFIFHQIFLFVFFPSLSPVKLWLKDLTKYFNLIKSFLLSFVFRLLILRSRTNLIIVICYLLQVDVAGQRKICANKIWMKNLLHFEMNSLNRNFYFHSPDRSLRSWVTLKTKNSNIFHWSLIESAKKKATMRRRVECEMKFSQLNENLGNYRIRHFV